MEAAILDWLQQVALRAFGLSVAALIAINGAFAAVIFVRRDRELVNRWTSRVLAANLVLVGTGVGVPILALSARVAVSVVAPFIELPAPSAETPDDELRGEVRQSRTLH